ncbi:MAG: hypothetical protein JNN13_17280 [Planctomycetes bacterium]|nr:hypothetical protein [Planctomycetota bacterium]
MMTPRHPLFALSLLAAATAVAQDKPDDRPAFWRERAERRAVVQDTKLLETVRAAVTWLREHQEEDGHWDAEAFMQRDPEGDRCDGAGKGKYSVGVTALALLAMLAQADPLLDEPCHQAADWLVMQLDENGRVPGETNDFVYMQVLTTLALTEAAALFDRADYRGSAAACLENLERHRNRGAAWRYQPQDGDNDTSITAWCITALVTGMQTGLDADATAVGEAIAWLDSRTNDAGSCGYTWRDEFSSRMAGDHAARFPAALGAAVTASALHARFAAGLSPDDKLAKLAAGQIETRPPKWDAQAIDYYYWLQASMALAQMPGSREQRSWCGAVQRVLLEHQRLVGAAKGSWDPIDVWGSEGGRVYATASCVLTLSHAWRCGSLDVMLSIPDEPTFQAVRAAWQDGLLAAAITALDKVPPLTLTTAQKAVVRRVRWYIEVEVARAVRTLAALEQLYPGVLAQRDAAKALVRRYAGLPIGDEAKKRLTELNSDPRIKAEEAAQKELAKLRPAYDNAVRSSSLTQKAKVRDQLYEIIRKYTNTQAAQEANNLLKWVQ